MFYLLYFSSKCCIYVEARARISYREDFQIKDTPESFRILRTIFDSVQNTFKSKCVGVQFLAFISKVYQEINTFLGIFSKYLFRERLFLWKTCGAY